MRENRPYGSEGGGIEINRFSLPLSLGVSVRHVTISVKPLPFR